MGNTESEKGSLQNNTLLQDTNLRIIFGVTLIAIMGVSSITPAFPKISRVLQISPEQVGLLITLFTLPGVFLTLFLGVLADRFGRKVVLVPSLFLFALAGTACAFTRNFHMLLVLRFLQGTGGAALGSLNITIIGDLYSGKTRTTAMGYNASVLSIGTASFPVVGGFLATFGWYFPFLLPLMAVPVGMIVLFRMENPEPASQQQLKEYLTRAFRSVQQRQVIGILIMSIATFIILYGTYLTYIPFLVGERFGGSSFLIGIIFSVGSISTAITSSQLGRISRMLPEHQLLRIAYLIYAVSLSLIPLMPGVIWIIPPVILFGIAQGLNIPNLQTLLASYASMELRAVIMSLNGMVLRLGQTVGPVIMGFMFSIAGLSATFIAGAVIALAMLIIAIILIRKNPGK